jgi:hypothetical protein
MDERSLLVVLIVVLVGASIGVVGAGTGVGSAAPIGDNTGSASGAAAGEGAPGVHTIGVSGSGYIEDQYETVGDHPGPPYVWSTASLEVEAALGGEPGTEYAVCASATDEAGNEIGDFGCEATTIGADSEETVPFTAEWPDEDEERVWITVEAEHRETGDRYYETAAVTLLHPEGDLSGDGLTNAREVELGTDFTTPDTSGNGLTDWEEVRVYGTDPLVADTSGDGVNDGTIARFPGNLDPTQPYVLHLYVGGILVALGLLIVGGGALGWKAMQRYTGTAGRETSGDRSDPAEPSDSSAAPADTRPPAPSAGAAGGEEPPLTKEEEICRLLREHAGRMKQSQLVEKTDWSQATVSRLLTRLEQEGTVTKLRVGRENIVELRDPESTERQGAADAQ